MNSEGVFSGRLRLFIMMIQKNILWVDCCTVVSAGLIVLLAAQWLSQMYHLSKNIIIFIGCINLLYACYSFGA
ncbi:hypothetical protein [Acinetobacter junii]|jgi:hypothetical protein|uniref:Uncharacterized protein n=1 Tax=Acinetobacter junii TaxID=40215 RepID=A0A8F6QMH2_ACIJU|nr:hypothetical protein [Acinetobacter junii]MCU4398644.1 hypothetical protein [Acinetobacter junii]MDH1004119.1 hypothetical protein [Acinetobacter junii]QXR12254.1 hypothetical protein EGT68_012515 [Acinetobacter junii]QXR29326.1 hypothetical protein EGT69_002960 [Acinetobacter junii]USR74956.1 hypothetical protein NGM19_02795 [Acinetobacter junii]